MTPRKIPLFLFLSAMTFGISSKEPILLLKDTRERKVLEQGVQKRVRQVSQVGSEELTWEVLISFPGLKKYQKIRWGGSDSISFS